MPPLAVAPLEKVSTEPCECEKPRVLPQGELCSSDRIVRAVREFIIDETVGGTAKEAAPRPQHSAGSRRGEKGDAVGALPSVEVIKIATKKLGCDGEACAVTHPQFLNHVARTAGITVASEIRSEALATFKPAGPRFGTDLLSNFNLDECLQRWAAEYPAHYCCPFSMMDFEREDYQFSKVSLPAIRRGEVRQAVFDPATPGRPAQLARPCTTFSCVLNTDVSTGPGKHWVCVFVDMRPGRPWTVEYFNSAGNPPPRTLTRWMEAAAADLRAAFPAEEVVTCAVTSVVHQRSRTECGVYVLYYIRARIEDVPLDHFREWVVPDKPMQEFRQHLFSTARA